MTTPPDPFGRGSVSLGMHLHHDGPITERVQTLLDEACGAGAAGFDGVTLSEHHGGFPGYLPNPTLLAAMVLDATVLDTAPQVWAGPSPTVLPLRAAATVIEDLAWIAARHPGRVGVGVAPGYHERDFELVGADFSTRRSTFWAELPTFVAGLAGSAAGTLGEDPAIAALAERPIPVVAGVGGPKSVRWAAEAGAGILVTSLLAVDDAHALVEQYRAAEGRGPVVLIRRVWVGDGGPDLDRQLAGYRSAGVQPDWMGDPMPDAIYRGPADEVAERLSADLAAVGAEAINIRLHGDGVGPDALAAQLLVVGDVVASVRQSLLT